MPLYEYQCDACGHRFETIQKFSDTPLEKCPKCGGAVRKLQSAPAFHLKGSGWYITDYARKDQAPAATSDTPAKDAPKTDTSAAPASKTEAAPAKSEGGTQKHEKEKA